MTTIPFASLWLIPRLPAFRKLRPDVEVFVSADTQIVDLELPELFLERLDLPAQPSVVRPRPS